MSEAGESGFIRRYYDSPNSRCNDAPNIAQIERFHKVQYTITQLVRHNKHNHLFANAFTHSFTYLFSHSDTFTRLEPSKPVV